MCDLLLNMSAYCAQLIVLSQSATLSSSQVLKTQFISHEIFSRTANVGLAYLTESPPSVIPENSDSVGLAKTPLLPFEIVEGLR